MLKSMKKALSFLLVITLLMSMMTVAGFSNIGVSATSGTYQIGDVDQDGEVTITDATYIQWSLVALIELDADQQYLADVDGDGEISITDATYIQWYLVNMLDEFPENKDGKKLGDKVTLENGQIVTEPVTQPVTQAPDTYTVKFTNNQGWTDVYLYAWGDNGDNAQWPGVKLTDKSVNGYNEEQYTATFDSKYTKIIFSNGGSEQTVDITYDPKVTGYYPTEKKDGKWEVESWTDTNPVTGEVTQAPTSGNVTQTPTQAPTSGEGTQAPTSAPSDKNTVKFTNNQNWTDVYLYAWSDAGSNAEWPGVKLTDKSVNTYNEEQYTATFDSKYTKIIFNNGGSEQTVDITYDNKVTGYYPTEKKDGKWEVESWTDETPDTGSATQAPTSGEETQAPTSAPSDKNTVKFTNNQGWTDVYLYAWSDAGSNAEWPGVKLTDKVVNTYNEEQYTATFDSKYTKIIFNNGGSEQTVDITYDNKVTGYYPTEKKDGKWEVESWTDGTPETGSATQAPTSGEGTQAPTQAPTSAPSDKNTVKFTNNQNWTDVYLYAWSDAGSNAEWPGVKLTDKSTNTYNEEQYTGTFDSKYTKIIFNNGGSEQTVDITYDNKVTGYYPTEKKDGKWEVESWTDGTPDTGSATQAPTSADADSLTYYYLPLAADVTANYTFKLNLNDEGGSAPENWHQYTFTKTDDKVGGVNVYKVTFKPGFDKANEVQFQTWNGDNWVKQVQVNEGKKTVLKDLDGKLVKADGSVVDYKPESTGDEPATQAPTSAPSDKNTVKFTNNQNWTDVYLYAWSDAGSNAEWPGVKLTDKVVNTYNEEQYTATFDSKYTKIIFNNGGSEQTVDITYDNKVTGYYPTEKKDGKWEVGSWTDTNPETQAPTSGEATQAPTSGEETQAPTSAPSDKNTVKFTNNQNWTDVYLYAWSDAGSNAEWPGVKLTDKVVNTYNEEQYTATFDSKYTKIIFNNGGSEQTVDITYDNKVTGYYPTEKKDGKWEVGSWTDTNPETGEATQAPTSGEGTQAPTSAPSDKNTVKFTNNQGWTDVYLYAWSDAGSNAEWPGVKLTDKAVNTYNEEQYTATFDSKYTKIIFNNGGSEQTVDIAYDNKVTGYYPTEKKDGKWEVGSWTDTNPETGEATQAPTQAPTSGEVTQAPTSGEETQAPTSAPSGTYTVKFTNNQGWTDVYVYAWADGAGAADKNAEWPGVKLTDKSTNTYNEEQYTATIDAKFTNLIFNNGGSEQTADIKYDGKVSGYYPTEKKDGKWEVGSWTDTNPETGEATQAPTSADADSLTYYYLPLAADVTANYTFKLNLNDEGGSNPENWHQYTFTKTDDKVGGVNVYKVTFKPGFEKANEVQFQTWNGDNWVKQVQVNEGQKTVLKDLNGKLVKADGTVVDYKPESTGDEPSTQAPTSAPATAAPTAAPADKNTVKFTNNQGWTDVYLYAWSDAGSNAEWPGVKLTDKVVNTYNEEQYTATFDSKFTKLIFNNGGSEQTVDIAYDNKVSGYYPTEKKDGKWEVGSWTDTNPETGEATQTPTSGEGTQAPTSGEGTQAPTSAPSDKNTVKFTNNQGWTDVYLYAWSDAGSNAEWPGVKLTDKAVNTYNEEQYTATFDSKFTKIIFNNGGSEQTVDIAYDNKVTGYYPTEKKDGKWEVGSWTDTTPETGEATQAPTQAPTSGEVTQAPTSGEETQAPTSAPSDKNTVKFTNNQGWTDVYLYAWGDNGDNAEWPGVKLTDKSTNTYNEEQYTATFDSKFTKLIFNNGGSEQTVDIAYDNKVSGYYPTEKKDGKWEVGSWTDTNPETGEATQAPTSGEGTQAPTSGEGTQAPTSAPSGTYTVKFTNNQGWTDVYVYAWADGAGAADKNAEWPGVKLTDKSTNTYNEEQYTATIDAKFTNLIFNNGGSEQTADIKYDGKVSGYYPTEKKDGKWEVGSWTDTNPETGDATQAPTSADADSLTYYYLPLAADVTANYTFKLNLNDEGGSNPENWHQYTFTKTDDKVGGVNVYKVTFKPGFEKANEVQFQTWNGDNWVKQVQVNEGQKTVLKDLNGKLVKADGTVVDYKPESTGDEPSTQAPTAAPATAAPAESYTVKFTNNQGWTDVYLYAWSDAGSNAEWPGVKLTDKAVNTYNEEQYTATFDSKYTKIIFNNGGSEQTVDIAYDNKVSGYYPTEKKDGKWEVGSWTDTNPETGEATQAPTSGEGTQAPTSGEGTQAPTSAPVTGEATQAPATAAPTDAPATAAPSGKNTVKFTNNQGWTDVYLYAWSDAGSNAEWPGVKLTDKSTNTYNEEQYTATFDSKYTKIIFNNGGSEQTADIKYDGKVTGYYLTEKKDGKWEVGSWTDTPETGDATQAPTSAPVTGEATQAPATAAPTDAPATAAPSGKNTVKFTNNQGWTDVYLYAWGDNGGNAEWPGVKLTDKSTNTYNEEQYTATFDSKYTKIIFNNGGSEQTVDITYDNKVTGYYPTEKKDNKWEVGSWTDAPETQAPTAAPVTGEATEATTEAPTIVPSTAAPEKYDFFYLPSAEQENAGYSYKFNYNDPEGVTDEHWHSFDFIPTNQKIDGVTVYGVQVPKLYNAVWEVQYQVYNKDTWVSQNSFKQVNLSDYDNVIIKYDGTKYTETPVIPSTAATEAPTAAPSDKNTVMFTNNQGWTDVYLYAWSDAGSNAEWPGVKLTDKSTNTYNEEQYTATFDSKYTSIIFSNGSGEQTVDITYDTTITGYYPTEKKDGKWEVGSWGVVLPTEEPTTSVPATGEATQAPTAAPTVAPTTTESSDTITVYFTDSMFYGDVNVYYWMNGGDWPGKAMTKVNINEYSQQVYSAEIPADVDGVIFNGNGRQTVDITENIKNGAWWYALETTDDAGHNRVQLVNVEPETAAPTQASTEAPETVAPTAAPTEAPETVAPTAAPTEAPETVAPTQAPTEAPTAAPTAAPADKNTVKFTNNQGWTDVYLYAWGDNGDNAQWPGVKLTDKSTNTYNEEQYTATFDTKYTKIIFNNGGSEQTVDITYDNKITGYYPTEKKDGKWEVGSWTDAPATGEATQAPTAASTAAPETQAPDNSYTYYFVPASTPAAGYTIKLNINDEAGTDSQYWHQFTMTKTDDTSGGVPVYKATFTADYAKANEIQFQTWNGDTWVTQTTVPGKVALADLDEKLVKADGTISTYEVDNGSANATDIIVTNPADTTKSVKLDLMAVSGMSGQWRVYTWNDNEEGIWTYIYNSSATVRDNFLLAHVQDHSSAMSWDSVDVQTIDVKSVNNAKYYLLDEKDNNGKYVLTTTAPETVAPTQAPTEAPATDAPTQAPTEAPTQAPTVAPTTQASTESNTYTFKFTNNKNWADVYLYAWNNDGSNAQWPGVKLTDKATNDYGEVQYTVTLPKQYTSIIFNNGNGQQTVDIAFDNTVAGYYVMNEQDGSGHYKVGSWK